MVKIKICWEFHFSCFFSRSFSSCLTSLLILSSYSISRVAELSSSLSSSLLGTKSLRMWFIATFSSLLVRILIWLFKDETYPLVFSSMVLVLQEVWRNYAYSFFSLLRQISEIRSCCYFSIDKCSYFFLSSSSSMIINKFTFLLEILVLALDLVFYRSQLI